MTDTSQGFPYYSPGSYSNGVFIAAGVSGNSYASGNNIVDSGSGINVGDTVTFNYYNSNYVLISTNAIYEGYVVFGIAEKPLILVGNSYFLLGIDLSAGQSYAVTPSSYTQGTVNCYCRGTRILTVRGEVPVEELQVGDLVATFAGAGTPLKPVRWLGRRRIDLRRHPDPENTHPIRIRAGALEEGCPHRDLVASPGHRMRIEDELVTALELVNGATIVQESPDEAEYWHIELDEHDLVLAEGMQAETYQDIGNRSGFENGAVVVLNPVLDGDVPEPCLPYAGASSDVRNRLITRAEALSWTRTTDPMPMLEADGLRIEPTWQNGCHRFALPAGCQTVRLRSRAGRPWDVDPHSGDRRQLGLKLHRLALGGFDGMQEVELDSADLRHGFHQVECDAEGRSCRWTNGDALLPLAELAPARTITAVEIAYDQALPFWAKPEEGIASVVMQTTLRVNGPGTMIMPPPCPARD